jgi:hypothetical protein
MLLQIWNINLTRQVLTKIDEKSTINLGYPTKRLDDMWMRVNSMEQIIHTRPLVECGDWNERGKSR